MPVSSTSYTISVSFTLPSLLVLPPGYPPFFFVESVNRSGSRQRARVWWTKAVTENAQNVGPGGGRAPCSCPVGANSILGMEITNCSMMVKMPWERERGSRSRPCRDHQWPNVSIVGGGDGAQWGGGIAPNWPYPTLVDRFAPGVREYLSQDIILLERHGVRSATLD